MKVQILRKEWQEAPDRGLKTRLEILDAALRVILDEGPADLSLARVAATARISKSLVGYHYGSVGEMLGEIFQVLGKRGQAATETVMLGRARVEDKLAGVIEAAFNWHLKSPACGRFFLLMYHQATVDPAIAIVHSAIIRTGAQRIEFFLYESGRYSKPEEVRLLAQVLHHLLSGALLKMISLKDEAKSEDYLRSVVAGYERITGLKLGKIRLARPGGAR